MFFSCVIVDIRETFHLGTIFLAVCVPNQYIRLMSTTTRLPAPTCSVEIPADPESPLKALGLAFSALASAVAAKQVGVIVHGGGIEVDAFELDAEIDGMQCERRDGHTRLYRVSL